MGGGDSGVQDKAPVTISPALVFRVLLHDVSLSFFDPRAIFEELEVGGELISVH